MGLCAGEEDCPVLGRFSFLFISTLTLLIAESTLQVKAGYMLKYSSKSTCPFKILMFQSFSPRILPIIWSIMTEERNFINIE